MLSLVGTWMQGTAQGQFMFDLTHSPAYLGYIGFASGIPTWVFMLYAGVIADRVPRRTLLVITQTFMMLLAFILAGLTFLKLVQPWHILVLASLLGIANAFDAPARLAFVPELVPKEDLTNAIALNATMFNTATAFGPAVAGITYSFFGPAWCFTINGISFIAVIIALLLMKLDPWKPVTRRVPVFQNLVDGLRYVAGEPTVRVLIVAIGLVSLFGLGFATLFPAWAVRILGGNATTTGLLQSARGLGALFGALTLATISGMRMRGKLLTLGSFIFPIFLMLFSLVHWLPLSMLVLMCVGYAFMFFVNLANATVQTITPDGLRGRVMSIYSLSFFGLMPLGSLLAGNAAARFGEPGTVLVSALIMLAFAGLMFLFAPGLRRVR
jgi:MFS family permease